MVTVELERSREHPWEGSTSDLAIDFVAIVGVGWGIAIRDRNGIRRIFDDRWNELEWMRACPCETGNSDPQLIVNGCEVWFATDAGIACWTPNEGGAIEIVALPRHRMRLFDTTTQLFGVCVPTGRFSWVLTDEGGSARIRAATSDRPLRSIGIRKREPFGGWTGTLPRGFGTTRPERFYSELASLFT